MTPKCVQLESFANQKPILFLFFLHVVNALDVDADNLATRFGQH